MTLKHIPSMRTGRGNDFRELNLSELCGESVSHTLSASQLLEVTFHDSPFTIYSRLLTHFPLYTNPDFYYTYSQGIKAASTSRLFNWIWISQTHAAGTWCCSAMGWHSLESREFKKKDFFCRLVRQKENSRDRIPNRKHIHQASS